jgi:hypothetical protein
MERCKEGPRKEKGRIEGEKQQLIFSGVNPCQVNNGGCEDTCVFLAPGKFNCTCGEGRIMDQDGRTCGCPEGFKELGPVCLGTRNFPFFFGARNFLGVTENGN